MSKLVGDQMTIGWYGTEEIAVAQLIRKRAGVRGLNQKVKEVLTAWIRGKKLPE